MKIILALLISCLPLLAQTTYPVLSTTSNRTINGGVTNLAVLNSNNVFTGTMRATGAVTLTNASNVFAGDGSALTGVGGGTNAPLLNGTNLFTGTNQFEAAKFFPANKFMERQLFSTGGLFFPTIYTNADNSTLTNNGGSHVGQMLFQVLMPPLLSPNSSVVYDLFFLSTNANSSSLLLYFYIGDSTNFIFDANPISTTAIRNFVSVQPLFAGWSFTNQIPRTGGLTALDPGLFPNHISYADTSTNWLMTVVMSTTSNHANAHVVRFTVSERLGHQ